MTSTFQRLHLLLCNFVNLFFINEHVHFERTCKETTLYNVSMNLCPTFPFCFPTFILFFLFEVLVFHSFSHNCAGQPDRSLLYYTSVPL